MKTLAVLLAAVAALAAAVALADRTVVYDSRRVLMHAANLTVLPDGGVMLEACGSVKQLDGGAGYSKCTDPVELIGAAQTRGLNLVNSADSIWKSQEGL